VILKQENFVNEKIGSYKHLMLEVNFLKRFFPVRCVAGIPLRRLSDNALKNKHSKEGSR